MAEYAPGVPIWVDVSSTDLDKSVDFYTGLFGWDANRGGPEMGGYTIFSLNGKTVCGGGPTQSPDQPPSWSTYVQSADAAATTEAVKSAGGQVIAGPMQVMDQGTLAVFQDPTGAFISIWQPDKHTGAELVNEVGSFAWNELYTRDLPRDVEFYKNVFGWVADETEMSPGKNYTMFKVGDRAIAGGLDMATVEIPPHIPPHWLVYFVVADVGASIAKAQELGATVNGPMDTPMGPFAVVLDPVGAAFAIIQFQSQG